jgi:hypothetical protein
MPPGRIRSPRRLGSRVLQPLRIWVRTIWDETPFSEAISSTVCLIVVFGPRALGYCQIERRLSESLWADWRIWDRQTASVCNATSKDRDRGHPNRTPAGQVALDGNDVALLSRRSQSWSRSRPAQSRILANDWIGAEFNLFDFSGKAAFSDPGALMNKMDAAKSAGVGHATAMAD